MTFPTKAYFGIWASPSNLPWLRVSFKSTKTQTVGMDKWCNIFPDSFEQLQEHSIFWTCDVTSSQICFIHSRHVLWESSKQYSSKIWHQISASCFPVTPGITTGLGFSTRVGCAGNIVWLNISNNKQFVGMSQVIISLTDHTALPCCGTSLFPYS